MTIAASDVTRMRLGVAAWSIHNTASEDETSIEARDQNGAKIAGFRVRTDEQAPDEVHVLGESPESGEVALMRDGRVLGSASSALTRGRPAALRVGRVDIGSSGVARVEIDSDKYGRGEVTLTVDVKKGTVEKIEVSKELARAGFQIDHEKFLREVEAKPGAAMSTRYKGCADKPTTAGVALCCVDVFIDWLME